MNWALEHRNELERANYVRKATHTTDYWFDFASSRVLHYVNATHGNFNLILFGDDEVETDFYAIPYWAIKDLLVKENLSEGDRNRWVGNVLNHQLHISRSGVSRNISEYFGRPIQDRDIGTEIENDYAVENAKREINVRQHQSRFRRAVLDNFNNRCCISGVTETDLLVASHIIPWADKIESRLDPSNGLCLMTLYDKLFDKGYFSLDDNLNVIITEHVENLSEPISKALENINGRTIKDNPAHPIGRGYLAYHRTNILNSFLP